MSPATTLRSRPIRLLVLVAVMFTVVELVAQVVDRRTGFAYDWGNSVVGQRYDHLTTRTAAATAGTEPAIDVVFVGSSVTAAAIDPPTVLAEIDAEATGYNAALGGSPMLTIGPWASEIVLPETCPSVLVVGVSVRDWNDNNPSATSNHDSFQNGLGYRRATGQDLSPAERAEGFFSDRLALVRLRPMLRSPKDLLNAFRWSGFRPLTAAGRDTAYPGTVGDYRPRDPELSPPAHFTDFDTGGRQQAAAAELLHAAADDGITTVVIDMPVLEQDLIDQLPGGATDLAAYDESIATLIEETGARYVDLSGAVQDRSAFSDEYHTNADGVMIVSELIGQELAALDLSIGDRAIRERIDEPAGNRSCRN